MKTRPSHFLACVIGLKQLFHQSFRAVQAFHPVFSFHNGLSHYMSHRDTSKAISNMSSILDSPAAERNKDHIWGVIMNDVLPILMKRGNSNAVIDVLEIAGGTGVHTQHFAQRMQAVCGNSFTWLPSDPEEASRASIDARVKVLQDSDDPTMVTAASCVQRAISITLEETGPIEGDDILSTYDMIICINMIHISPWTATLGLMKIAKERLKNGGVLYCYGPFKEGGKAVESNL